MKKNKFLAFFFGMIPGAGQMYLGYMKRGFSLMTAFFLLIAVTAFLQMEFLLFALPIIWFYAFFDTLNLSAQGYDARYCQPDDYLFHLDSIMGRNWFQTFQKRHLIAGAACILLGFYLVLTNVVAPFLSVFGIWIYDVLRVFPPLIIAAAIIILGVHLIRGEGFYPAGKMIEDDFKEYHNNEES